MIFLFFFGSELVSVPLSSPGHQALCFAVPKSRRLSPNLTVQSRAGSGALALLLHRQLCAAAPASESFRFFPFSSSSPNASDLLPGGCSAEVRASPFGHTTSHSSCRAQGTEGPAGTPPALGLLLQLGRAYSFTPDSSARIDAWEKLITACSCCSRAPLQLPCLADAPGNSGGSLRFPLAAGDRVP